MREDGEAPIKYVCLKLGKETGWLWEWKPLPIQENTPTAAAESGSNQETVLRSDLSSLIHGFTKKNVLTFFFELLDGIVDDRDEVGGGLRGAMCQVR